MANNNLQEFTSEIIEIFEDFLDFKGIILENEEKEDSEDPANIYGSDYGFIQTQIEDTMDHWNLNISEDNTYMVTLDIPEEEKSDVNDQYIKDIIEIGSNMVDSRIKVVTINKIGGKYDN